MSKLQNTPGSIGDTIGADTTEPVEGFTSGKDAVGEVRSLRRLDGVRAADVGAVYRLMRAGKLDRITQRVARLNATGPGVNVQDPDSDDPSRTMNIPTLLDCVFNGGAGVRTTTVELAKRIVGK